MNFFKRLFFTSFFLSTVLGGLFFVNRSASTSESPAIKIGTVDMQEVLQTINAGQEARKKLETEFNAKKKELQKKENQLKEATELFKKQASVLSEKARMEKQNKIQEQIMAFQQETGKAQMDIQQKERELTQPLLENIRKIVAKLAEERQYTLVLEKNENTVLYSLAKDDLSKEVITRMNKKND